MSTDPQRTPPEIDPALDGDARAHSTADAPPSEGTGPAFGAPAFGSPAFGSPAAENPDGIIARLTAERDEMRDKWMRAEAETQNVRVRAKRDLDDTRQYAVQKFAADVVEAAENLRRGLQSLPPASPDEPAGISKLREGLEGVERHFHGIMERNGIKAADPTGQPFDANMHQAMAEQPSAEHKPGTVMQAWTQAWTLNGRLLKPAMVVVAKAGDAA